MLIGLDGTVGGPNSLFAAARKVISDRANRVWNAMNEPIHVSNVSDGVAAIGKQFAKVGRSAGAGSIADAEYTQVEVENQLRDLRNFGFIGQLCQNNQRRHAGRSLYLRGPTTLGMQDREIVERAALEVSFRRRGGEELVVAGYSRGGLNAINLCDRIVKHGGEVELLILFDPVERDLALGICNISAGVRNCVLVQRGGNWITWRPYKRELKAAGLEMKLPDVWLTNSRWWFGRMVDRSDRRLLTRGDLSGAEFDATHAAFGGLPWTGDNPPYMTQRGDRRHASDIAGFVNRSVHNLCGWNPHLKLLMPLRAS